MALTLCHVTSIPECTAPHRMMHPFHETFTYRRFRVRLKIGKIIGPKNTEKMFFNNYRIIQHGHGEKELTVWLDYIKNVYILCVQFAVYWASAEGVCSNWYKIRLVSTITYCTCWKKMPGYAANWTYMVVWVNTRKICVLYILYVLYTVANCSKLTFLYSWKSEIKFECTNFLKSVYPQCLMFFLLLYWIPHVWLYYLRIEWKMFFSLVKYLKVSRTANEPSRSLDICSGKCLESKQNIYRKTSFWPLLLGNVVVEVMSSSG